MVHCLPKIMVWVAFVLAIVLLVITGIVFLIDNRGPLRQATGWAIFLAILAFMMAIILAVYLIVHRKRVKYCGVFLQNATYMLK